MPDEDERPADRPTSAGSRSDFILGAAIVCFGLVLVFWAIPAQINDAGSFGLPPSLAPKALSWLIVALGAALAVWNVRALGRPDDRPGLRWSDAAHLAASVGSVAAMLLLMALAGAWIDRPYAGFLIAAPLGLIAFTAIHSGAPAWAYAFNAIAAPAAVYAAFWWGLRLPLP